MIKQRLSLLLVLSTCLITTSNAMEEKPAKRSVTIDDTFLARHHEPFKTFISSMRTQKKIVDRVSWIPGGRKLVQIGAQFAGYEKELKDLPYLERYFDPANERRQMQTINSLKTDSDYQNKATDYVSNVFDALAQQSDKGRDTFLRVLHEQNIRTLGQPAGTTRERLCQLVNIRFANGTRAIEDGPYFQATTLSLFTLYIYENGR